MRDFIKLKIVNLVVFDIVDLHLKPMTFLFSTDSFLLQTKKRTTKLYLSGSHTLYLSFWSLRYSIQHLACMNAFSFSQSTIIPIFYSDVYGGVDTLDTLNTNLCCISLVN